MLTQLGLAYFVEDGILVVTSKDQAREPLPPSIATPDPILKMVEKSERGELTSIELNELIEVMRLRRVVRLMHEGQGVPDGGEASESRNDGARLRAEDEAADVKALRKELRELIQLLRAEKSSKEKSEAGNPRGAIQ